MSSLPSFLPLRVHAADADAEAAEAEAVLESPSSSKFVRGKTASIYCQQGKKAVLSHLFLVCKGQAGKAPLQLQATPMDRLHDITNIQSINKT